MHRNKLNNGLFHDVVTQVVIVTFRLLSASLHQAIKSTDHASVFMSRGSDPASVAYRVCFTSGLLSNRTSELEPSPS